MARTAQPQTERVRDEAAPSPAADRLSQAERAYLAIRRRLVLLDIRPGEVIAEAKLCAELGLGRTPVREAVKRLEHDRLVVSYPRRGTFATSVDITELSEITEIRLALEPLAARRAAELLNAERRRELAELRHRLAGIPDDADARSLMSWDLDVHRVVSRAGGSAHLADLLERYSLLATRIWCLAIERMPGVAGHVRDHAEVLGAILAGDGERAARLVAEHITRFEAEIRRLL